MMTLEDAKAEYMQRRAKGPYISASAFFFDAGVAAAEATCRAVRDEFEKSDDYYESDAAEKIRKAILALSTNKEGDEDGTD